MGYASVFISLCPPNYGYNMASCLILTPHPHFQVQTDPQRVSQNKLFSPNLLFLRNFVKVKRRVDPPSKNQKNLKWSWREG